MRGPYGRHHKCFLVPLLAPNRVAEGPMLARSGHVSLQGEQLVGLLRRLVDIRWIVAMIFGSSFPIFFTNGSWQVLVGET